MLGKAAMISSRNDVHHAKKTLRSTEGVGADMIGSVSRGDMNNKQTYQHRGSVKSPKIGPKLTDKSWITRGLKPDLKLEYRD